MPTEKQRRAAAQRRLARQLARRQEQRRKQKRLYAIAGSSFAVVAVVFLVLIFATDVFSGASNDKSKNAASPSASSSASTTPSATATGPTPSPYATTTFATADRAPKSTSGPCQYAETADTLKSPYNKDVGLPPDPDPTPATGTAEVTMTTSQGDITLQLDRSAAPCAVQSFLYLAGKGFFNNTSCPRLTTKGIFVLQCGDPSSSQQGGPTYEYKEEITAKTKYSAGVIAMANSNNPPSTDKPTTSSQFFMIYKDSTSLPKDYSVIGKITKGLNIVQKVADGKSSPADDGKPILGMTIKSASAAA
ncbi:MAG TPA: peptidylprolyl isomerase [Mycobacteriales bacterium]|nr:peptidylprolyl isomerase [Mycobacteriales bacterium]